jgi:hypothetical protein
MKSFLILLLAAALGWASYQYGYPLLAKYAKLDQFNQALKAAEQKPQPTIVEKAPEPSNPHPEPMVMPEATQAPKPMVIQDMPPAKTVDADGFEPPVLPDIAQATQNWSSIPKSAFPRLIKLTESVDVSMNKVGGSGGGKSKLKVGTPIYAIAQEGEELIIAARPESELQGRIKMSESNLKAELTDMYGQWKTRQIQGAKRAFMRKKQASSQPESAPPAAAAVGDNSKPARGEDGSYALLLSSMSAGQVTEIKPGNIKEWGDARQEEGYWKIPVKYETETLFGKFDTEAEAFVKNGKVEKWIYTGSGEVVP